MSEEQHFKIQERWSDMWIDSQSTYDRNLTKEQADQRLVEKRKRFRSMGIKTRIVREWGKFEPQQG